MTLPAAYAWLADEPGPRMLAEALKLHGTLETPGWRDNPVIMAWAKETGVRGYSADSVPWCGLFMAVVALRAGKEPPPKPLWALNWARWGENGGQPELGDVLVFVRPGGGHVGLYVGEDGIAYHVLGGNQSNAVSIARINKDRLYACRAYFAVGKPANVRPVLLEASGRVSADEA
jgi:uncharacterized protein (TIGR02594 family)